MVVDVRAVGSASAKDGLTKQRDKRRRARSPSRPTAARVDLSSGGLLAVARSAAAHEDGSSADLQPLRRRADVHVAVDHRMNADVQIPVLQSDALIPPAAT